ncbi:MAG TPA: AAA-associated domain-containing protein [Thermoplasmataceae archaeon]|nr:AAA-associated domain-containing protein [Thermoplasmatales archaeon AK]HLH86035.1 AAA-associated domain-containing protein [Thermoplasmataceae archaeon]
MHVLETESVGDLVGLLEILDDINRTVDIATLDDSLDEERTTLLNLLNDAEGLGFINVDNGDVTLTPLGKKFLDANVSARKEILRDQLKNVEPFHTVIEQLRLSDDRSMARSDIEEILGERMQIADIESTFRVLLNWGRYSKLLDYDAEEERLFLT